MEKTIIINQILRIANICDKLFQYRLADRLTHIAQKVAEYNIIDENSLLEWEEYDSVYCPVKIKNTTKKKKIDIKNNKKLTVSPSKDYVVFEANNPSNEWSVKKDIFHKAYKKQKDGTWQKIVKTKIAKVNFEGVCKTREGDVKFKPGWYICKGPEGEVWPVDEKTFKKKYKK